MQINKFQKTEPIRKNKHVENSNDMHIDQDFPGFPHSPAKENLINPKTEEDKSGGNLKPDFAYKQENLKQ
jgi:hypothetical protein